MSQDLEKLIAVIKGHPEIEKWILSRISGEEATAINRSESEERHEIILSLGEEVFEEFILCLNPLDPKDLDFKELEKKYFLTRGKLADTQAELRFSKSEIKDLKKALTMYSQGEEKSLKFRTLDGYIPPQNVKLEEIILGSYIQNRSLMENFNQPYLNLMFYKENHRIIHSALMDIPKKITKESVVSELRKRGELEATGGPYYIEQIMQSKELTSDPEIIQVYINELESHHLKREIIVFCNELSKKCYMNGEIGSVPEEIRAQSAKILELLPLRFRKNYDTRSAIIQIKEDLSELEKRNGKPKISTGYQNLDRVTHGILSNKLFISGARPKQGKSMLALCIADNIAQQGFYSAYFSHEQRIDEHIQRLAARKAQVDVEKFEYFEKGFTKKEKERIERAFEEIKNEKIIFEGGRPNDLDYIINRSRQLKATYPSLSLIVFDGLQAYEKLCQIKHNKSDFFYKVLNTMKYEIAEPLGITVWLNAQLKSQVEKYKDKKPRTLDDFSDCKGIPEVCDGAFLLYRPEEYLDDERYKGWINIDSVALRSSDKKGKQFRLGINTKYSDIFEI